MGLLDRLLGHDRRLWFVCYTCMMQTGHNAVESVFYSEGPPAMFLGRPLMQCPRCQGANTKSFQELHDEGSEAVLWGLERIVRKHRRGRFELKNTTGVR